MSDTRRTQRCLMVVTGCLLMVAGCTAGEKKLDLTFLGNEGFLLRGGERSVLIDAISGEGLTGYVPVPYEERRRLEAAQPPFGQVDLVLATHSHADHFDARPVGIYLAAAPRAQFVSTEQSFELIQKHAVEFEQIKDRLHAYNPEPGKRVRLKVGGIKLQLFYLDHGNTQNLAFIFELGGLKVLHVGDTDADAATFAQYDLPAKKIDIAFIPFWLLLSEDGPAMIREQIGPAQVVAMHVPYVRSQPRYFGKSGSRRQLYIDLEEAWPGVILMSEPMETRRFP